jgi:hypothetical protein
MEISVGGWKIVGVRPERRRCKYYTTRIKKRI